MQIDAALLTGDAVEAAEQAAQREAEGYGAVWSFEGPHDPFFPLVLASQKTERDHHGHEGLQEALHRMSKQGQWAEMMGLVSDELFDEIAASGTPDQVAEKLRSRNTFADRTTLVLYNETSPDAPVELVRKLTS